MSDVIDRIVKQFEDNALLWGMYYCPHYFRKQSPAFHLMILKASEKYHYLAVQAPRGSAKSSILVFLRTIHRITFKKERFIVIVQNTYKKASASLEAIKAEYRDNEKLKNDFGITLDKDAEGDSVFRHKDGYCIRVLCKGADQLGSIRGEKFGAYRPTLILVDDLEDDEMVRNIERRMELETTFNEVIKYAGEAGETKIIVVGTILHDDSLMAKLVSKDRYTYFKKLFFKARYELEGNKVSLWPEKWTIDDLKQMEEEDPSGFAKEMQGDPSSGAMEGINRADFRYWRIENQQAILFDQEGYTKARYALTDLKAAIAVDLAWETKRDSDFSVIFPGFITPNSEVLYEDYIHKRGMRPDELEDVLFNLESRLEQLTGRRVVIGFEKAKLEKVMKWWMSEAMKRRNKFLWLKDLQWDGDKLQRILTRLGNRYAQHVIYHKRTMGELENQLIRIRSTAHDDIADAAQGLVQLLQYAPQKRKEIKEDSAFDFWRNQAIKNKKQPTKEAYIFGNKNNIKNVIPSKIGYK